MLLRCASVMNDAVVVSGSRPRERSDVVESEGGRLWGLGVGEGGEVVGRLWGLEL